MFGRTDSVFHSGESIISTSEIKEYICSRYCVFPKLRINEFLICYGSQWYTFNSFLQNQDCQEKKILHYFYTLCELIYVKARETDVFQEIDLSYNETISEYVLLALKFGNYFSTDCQVCYVQEILELLYQDRLICELFEMFLRRKFETISKKSIDGGFICYL